MFQSPKRDFLCICVTPVELQLQNVKVALNDLQYYPLEMFCLLLSLP